MLTAPPYLPPHPFLCPSAYSKDIAKNWSHHCKPCQENPASWHFLHMLGLQWFSFCNYQPRKYRKWHGWLSPAWMCRQRLQSSGGKADGCTGVWSPVGPNDVKEKPVAEDPWLWRQVQKRVTCLRFLKAELDEQIFGTFKISFWDLKFNFHLCPRPWE